MHLLLLEVPEACIARLLTLLDERLIGLVLGLALTMGHFLRRGNADMGLSLLWSGVDLQIVHGIEVFFTLRSCFLFLKPLGLRLKDSFAASLALLRLHL